MSTDIRRFRRRPNGTAPPAEGFTYDFSRYRNTTKRKAVPEHCPTDSMDTSQKPQAEIKDRKMTGRRQ